MSKDVKVGDRIRVIRVDEGFRGHGYFVGEVYEVVGITPGLSYPEIITPKCRTWLVDSEYEIVSDEPLKKPPLGLKPRSLHMEERLVDVKSAIQRYLDANRTIPDAWISEYNELIMEVFE